ncbi:MAG: OmpA family protein [Alphaproteobacteria bacterium]|nr:OmpA family protein [Alphaproteobacteria bacterium]
MAKKKGGGAPAWMATFADLMSLLLTLFVLLLTFAEMDVLKYKAISGSVSSAFGVSREDKLAGVVEIDGSLLRTAARDVDPSNREEEITAVPTVSMEIPEVPETPEITEKELEARAQKVREDKAEDLKEKLTTTMENEIEVGGILVERTGDEVVIRFPSEIAFPSGSGSLNVEFGHLLDRLMPILEKTPGELIVSGHTDNVPVRSGLYQSNWDLSASRATSVVHRFLAGRLIDPGRITVQGYGDSRPIASNDTPEGRAMNRRVEISIISPDKVEADKAEEDNVQTGTDPQPEAQIGSGVEAETEKTGAGFYDE